MDNLKIKNYKNIFLLSALLLWPQEAQSKTFSPDINQDGGITIVEIIVTQQNIFKEIDTNEDLIASEEELKNFVSGYKDINEWSFDEQFDFVDQDNNKNISQMEFLEDAAMRFRKKDRNRDGIITTNEQVW